MNVRLNPKTQHVVDLLFSVNDREAASRLLLEMEGQTFSFMETNTAQLAALKVSHGEVERLRKAIAVGHIDGRDLASAAGFVGVTTSPDENCKKWAPKSGRGSYWERFREKRAGIQ